MSNDQIRTLGNFMFPGKMCQFLKTYYEATSKPHGYLIIDSKQNTPDDERLKTDIFKQYTHTFTLKIHSIHIQNIHMYIPMIHNKNHHTTHHHNTLRHITHSVNSQ